MKASDYIVVVSEMNFEYDVIAFSQHTPVVVDFWAEWCVPCRTLGPILESLTVEAAGSFRLAKVNIDENVNLALRFNIRSIPAVKSFRAGQVVSEFFGVQPEPRLREFLRSLAPSENDLFLEKAKSMSQLRQWQSAEAAYRKILESSPDHPAALLGLSKCLLALGRPAESQKILHKFPASREYHTAEIIRPLADAIVRADSTRYEENDTQEAAYWNSLRLVKLGNFPAAMDGFLDVLRQDKHYRNDEVRRLAVAILELLGEEEPLTRSYRSELASVLF